MPSQYLSQATHNKTFLNCIEEQFPEDFHDWKITVMFYIAVHLLKEMAEQYHADIGRTHEDTAKRLDPEKTEKPALEIPDKVWRCYRHLYRYSKIYRYDGLLTEEILLEARITDYNAAKNALTIFCDHMSIKENIAH